MMTFEVKKRLFLGPEMMISKVQKRSISEVKSHDSEVLNQDPEDLQSPPIPPRFCISPPPKS